MKKTELKDRVYRLMNGMRPLSYTIQSRNSPNYPLMHFDESKSVNRVLRYASNQKSPFEDEQDGNAITPPVVFEDGQLFVPKENVVLQQFLSLHPLVGIVFEEVDNEKEAAVEIESLNTEVDALIEAKSLALSQLEMVYRVLFGKDPTTVSTAELRRDVLIYAKKDPKEFLRVLRDPELAHQAKVALFFEKGILVLKNNNKEVWANTNGNKKKLMSVPFNEEPIDATARFLKTDEGIEILKALDVILEK